MTHSFFSITYIALIGYIVVFMVLCILFALVTILRKFDDAWREKEAAKLAKLADRTQNIDDITLILISAAIGAYCKGGVYIKKIRILPSTNIRNSLWSVQGRGSVQISHHRK